jgi:lincosamide nucleotidyltransferase B/F
MRRPGSRRLRRSNSTYVNEFGNGTAIFDNLVRGEFHFERASNVRLVEGWRTSWLPSLEQALLVDKDGELSRLVGGLVRCPPDKDTAEQAGHGRAGPVLVPRLINWTLMGSNLLKRGEYARSLAFLALVHQHLLRAVRLAERNTANLSRAPRALTQRPVTKELLRRWRRLSIIDWEFPA